MTNREAFNQYIRMTVEKQIRYMEAMSDAELVKYCITVPKYHIEAKIGNRISFFKAMMAGMPVGTVGEMITWFNEEAPETIDLEHILFIEKQLSEE